MNQKISDAVTAGLSAAKPLVAPVREEDPRARAGRRALELRDQGAANDDEGTDKFYIDPKCIPDGWSYEWKRFTTLGKEDPSYQVAMAHKGWEAVPASRHPNMMPLGFQGNTIEREGMLLMERPLEITNEAKARDLRIARGQVEGKQAQLSGAPVGHFERDNKGTPMAKVRKSFENIPIPKE